MKVVPRNKIVYSFSSKHEPAEHVQAGETVLVKTEDAFGGQVKNERDSLDTLVWSRVDGATGPIFVENAKPGDTLVVEILDIKVEKEGAIVTIPKSGILAGKKFKPSTKKVKISDGYISFDKDIKVKATPMIGTIGVTPKSEIPTGSLGKHGGNMDVKELTAGTKLYLPIFTEGALFAADRSIACSINYYVVSLHHNGIVDVACEGVGNVVGCGNRNCWRVYASVSPNINGSRCLNRLNFE
jgi:amidase